MIAEGSEAKTASVQLRPVPGAAGRLYRCSAFDDTRGLRLGTVVDLRRVAADEPPVPCQVGGDGRRVERVNLVGPRTALALARGLPWSSVTGFLLSRAPRDVNALFAEHYMADPDRFVEFYVIIARHSTREMLALALILSNRANFPVAIHCTAGKDRTGVVAALFAALIGVDWETIAEDYARSRENLVGALPGLRKAGVLTPDLLGVRDPWLASPKESMVAFLRSVERIFGGVEAYFLDHVCVPPPVLRRVVQNLLGE